MVAPRLKRATHEQPAPSSTMRALDAYVRMRSDRRRAIDRAVDAGELTDAEIAAELGCWVMLCRASRLFRGKRKRA